MMRYGRRSFLAACMTALAVGGGGLAHLARTARATHSSGGSDGVPPFDMASAIAIGDAYRRSCPADRDARRLANALAERHIVVADAGASLGERLALAVRADFEHGDVVNVGGWMLARSEAMFCGLVAACEQGNAPRAVVRMLARSTR